MSAADPTRYDAAHMVLALLLAFAAPAADEVSPPPSPRHALTYESLLVARVNPLGLEERLWIGYRYRLYDRPGKIFDGSRIAVFANPILSPAVARLGGTLEVTPLAILRLRATYGFVQYYETFEYLQSFDSPYADFSDQRHDDGEDAGENYPGRGGQAELAARLQLKAWRIAVRNESTFLYSHLALRGDDDVFYSPRYDALMPNHGWVLVNDSDVLYVHDLARGRSVVAGVRNTLTKQFYPGAVYQSGETAEDPIGVMDRLGPLFAFSFYDDPTRRFNKPTILFITQWHLSQPWRTGKVEVTDDMGDTHTRGSSQALPTIVLGFYFQGDIIGG